MAKDYETKCDWCRETRKTVDIAIRENKRLRLALAEIMDDPERAREIAIGALK